MVKDTITEMIRSALEASRSDQELVLEHMPPIVLEKPRQADHGDLTTTVALALAPSEHRPPRQIAEILARHLAGRAEAIGQVEVAGPGYINFFLKQEYWYGVLREVEAQGASYGRCDLGQGRRIQVEFVSANPTGPLHVGHGRGAAVGDALASLLAFAGYAVEREFYINDAGRQMELLGRSAYARYRQVLGEPDYPLPEEGYPGTYLVDIAQEIARAEGNRYVDAPEAEWLPFFIETASEAILNGIRRDLEAFGVRFDTWFSERRLYQEHRVEPLLKTLQEKGLAYEQEGALWVRTTLYGDDKDRVVRRSNGETTYFASDISYHQDKLARKFDRLINVWGADHHGYVARTHAAVQILGRVPECLTVVLVQLVSLLRQGKPVAMGKREGEFVTLAEVVSEVGKDAARFIFLTRRAESHLEFDLDLAKAQSNENPVYYVQYAHARICSLFRQAQESGVGELPPLDTVDLSRLDLPEELALLKQLAAYPEVIRGAAEALEPHRLTAYLLELAGGFHAYYFKQRFITEDLSLTHARLVLAKAIRTVIASALGLLGVTAPERM